MTGPRNLHNLRNLRNLWILCNLRMVLIPEAAQWPKAHTV
jgi:hypothetical protein